MILVPINLGVEAPAEATSEQRASPGREHTEIAALREQKKQKKACHQL